MLHRRDLLRFGLTGGLSAATARLSPALRRADDLPPSPRVRPFVQPLPLPPVARPVAAFAAEVELPPQADVRRLRHFHLVSEARRVRLHPDLAPTSLWGYRDVNSATHPFLPGPTLVGRAGAPLIVRHENRLPRDHVGFGLPITSVHFHGGHVPAASDGFPEDLPGFEVVMRPGERHDYAYPLLDPGFSIGRPDATDRPSTLWYHDHLLDFTGPNVHRGLVGFFLFQDELDTLDERTGLRLPSGEFDVPLLLLDRRLDRNAQLVYDGLLDHNGFLGDLELVNGAVQPYLEVRRRKYRLRLLNGANARFYGLVVADRDGAPQPFERIATEGGLLATPERGATLAVLSPAQRQELVLDFARYPAGTVLYLENRLDQPDGRGPRGTFEEPELLARGTRLLELRVVGGAVEDPSRVPDVLRPFAPVRAAELAAARRRQFRFERRHGVWVINGEGVDLERPLARVVRNEPELWTLTNHAGGWWHPIHVHLEFMHVLRRDGGPATRAEERDGNARRDVITLGPGGEVEVFFNFRDYSGPYVFHCHTLEHEDAFMMGRFDVL